MFLFGFVFTWLVIRFFRWLVLAGVVLCALIGHPPLVLYALFAVLLGQRVLR